MMIGSFPPFFFGASAAASSDICIPLVLFPCSGRKDGPKRPRNFPRNDLGYSGNSFMRLALRCRWILALLGLFVAAQAGAQGILDTIRARGELVIATDP